MLFDTEDYANTGTVGKGRTIPEKTLPNKMSGLSYGGYGDMRQTALSTSQPHMKAVSEIFTASMSILPIELRNAAFDKYFEFLDRARAFKISEREYWHMMHSLPVLKSYGAVQFQSGDWFYVTEYNGSLDPQTDAKYIANSRGMIDSYYAQNAPNHPQYKYNNDALLFMSGEKFEYKAVLCGGENIYTQGSAPGAPSNYITIKYTPYSSAIDSDYYAKFEELIACEKELFIAMEGFNPFVGE
jgi:hypothetical protein